MPPSAPFEPTHRRLATYGYLAPLVAGRRVLELGCGSGEGAARLLALNAAGVVCADEDANALAKARANHRGAGLTFVNGVELRSLEAAGPFDVVVVPEASVVLRQGHPLAPSVLRRLLPPRGRLVLMAGSADRQDTRDGVGYFELVESLEALFPRVRMFGVTPFAAFGVAEFTDAVSGLRVDSGLIDEAAEQPTHYVAVGGPDEPIDLGYALVQVPIALDAAAVSPGPVAERPARAPVQSDAAVAGEVVELRRKLAETQGEVEGVLRVSRAQSEEIEELRARLRRGAEARSELDQEVARLRRALTEADESVLTLTRKTTEEMTALAQRLTAGLRVAEAAPVRNDDGHVARLRDELERKTAELATRESALSDRDDRIAALEAERQDLVWRLDAAEEQAREAVGRAHVLAAERQSTSSRSESAPGSGAVPEEVLARLAVREQALEQYRHAAVAHVDEVNRLREELAEQSTLVAELEESLANAEARLQAADREAARLRQIAAEIEQSDRARRSRLAEVEGTLLRLQRQQATSQGRGNNGVDTSGSEDAQRKIAELSAQVVAMAERVREAEQSRLQAERNSGEAERLRQEAERRWGDAVERMVGLEQTAAQRERAREDDQAARTAQQPEGAAGPRLDSALKEVSRLRDALERSEEQLWETKGQLLLDRERMAVLENQVATLTPVDSAPLAPPGGTVSEAAHQAILEAVQRELSAIESGLRVEIARLDSVERSIESWREDLAVTDTEGDLFSRA